MIPINQIILFLGKFVTYYSKTIVIMIICKANPKPTKINIID